MKTRYLVPLALALLGCGSPTPRTSTLTAEQPRALATQPQQPNAALLKAAEEHYMQGRLDAAENDLRVILKTEPRNHEAYYYLSMVEEARVKARRDARIRAKFDQKRPNCEREQLWYPTLPPQEIR